MKRLAIALTAAGLAMFCVSQAVAQTSRPGGGVPAPSSSSGTASGMGTASGTLGTPSGSSTMTNPAAGTNLGVPPQNQPTVSPSTRLPDQAAPPASALQNPLTAQGSGGNVEAGQGSQNLPSYGAGGFNGEQTEQKAVQRVNANDPRLVRFNNEWWYWMPGDYWVYYRNNNWSRYDPYAFQPLTSDVVRYQTGYRGPTGPVYYLDENGLRYRRFYAPELPRNQSLEAARPQANTQTTNNQANTQTTIGGAVRGDTGPSVGAEIGGAARNQ